MVIFTILERIYEKCTGAIIIHFDGSYNCVKGQNSTLKIMEIQSVPPIFSNMTT